LGLSRSCPLLKHPGQAVQLRLFANRINQPLRYTWQVSAAPAGSSAVVENPIGASISPLMSIIPGDAWFHLPRTSRRIRAEGDR